MDSIRVLDFGCAHNSPEGIVQRFYTELASKPQLHMMIAVGCTPVNIPPFANLRHLDVSSHEDANRLIGAAPYLESLAISGTVKKLSTSTIPWNTLHEIELQLTDDRSLVLENFLASSVDSTFPCSKKFYLIVMEGIFSGSLIFPCRNLGRRLRVRF